MSPFNQFDGGFTFADAAITENKQPFPIHLHEHAVTGDTGSQFYVQRSDQSGNEVRSFPRIGQQRHLPIVGACHHFRERLQSLAQNHAHRSLGEKFTQSLVSFLQGHCVEITIFHFTQDLHPKGFKQIIKTRKGKTGTIGIGTGNFPLIHIRGQIDTHQIEFVHDFL